MYWIFLIIAIVFEVFATSMMKLSYGLTVLIPSVLMFIGYALSFTFLAFALKVVDVSIAYAIWSAVGIVLISAIGIIFFGENINLVKVISTLLIIIGVVGLKLSST